MKTNQIYSILSRGLPYGNPDFSRFVQETAYAYENEAGRDMLAALTPYNDDMLRAVCAERLTQFLWASDLRERAADLDPNNSYDKAAMQFPEPGSEIIEISVTDPFTITVVADEDVLLDRGDGRFELECVVDSLAQNLTYNSQVFSYTVTNGLSSKIGIIPGLDIKIRSDFAAAQYVFIIRHTLPASLDWSMIRRRTELTTPVWTDPSLALIWNQDPRWDQRLAAYVMSTVELFKRG